MSNSYEEAVAQLTAPGAMFEIVTEPVRGLPMKNFKHREKSLREKVANTGLRGETVFMVQGDRRISYAEHARLVWGAGRALKEGFGFRHGDRLAILAYNSPDWLVALFGLPPTRAIAIVPAAFVTLNSFGIAGLCGMATTLGVWLGKY